MGWGSSETQRGRRHVAVGRVLQVQVQMAYEETQIEDLGGRTSTPLVMDEPKLHEEGHLIVFSPLHHTRHSQRSHLDLASWCCHMLSHIFCTAAYNVLFCQ